MAKDKATEFLASEKRIDFGDVEQPTSDLICWSWKLEDGAEIVWESHARYDENDIYIGRSPSLLVGGAYAPFEQAVSVGNRLGQETKWLEWCEPPNGATNETVTCRGCDREFVTSTDSPGRCPRCGEARKPRIV